MRHGKKVNHLGRTNSHRKAMLGNMATSLILHKRITTTLAKAKALRVYVEPILTKSKSDTTHSRRTVFSYLQDKDAVSILFRDIAEKIANRPGGYTRIIKMENRLGDNAEMAIIELVDYNTVYGGDNAQTAKKTTRRRGGKAKVAAPAAKDAAAPVAEEVVETPVVDEAPVAEAPVAEVAVEEAPVAEAPAATEEEAPAADNEENAEKGE
jgi:large subunit ribosomal protein L17